MKVRIISDGSIGNTRIVDSETGDEIRGVTSIDWHADVDGVSAKIELVITPMVVEGTASVLYVCGRCKQEMAAD